MGEFSPPRKYFESKRRNNSLIVRKGGRVRSPEVSTCGDLPLLGTPAGLPCELTLSGRNIGELRAARSRKAPPGWLIKERSDPPLAGTRTAASLSTYLIMGDSEELASREQRAEATAYKPERKHKICFFGECLVFEGNFVLQKSSPPGFVASLDNGRCATIGASCARIGHETRRATPESATPGPETERDWYRHSRAVPAEKGGPFASTSELD